MKYECLFSRHSIGMLYDGHEELEDIVGFSVSPTLFFNYEKSVDRNFTFVYRHLIRHMEQGPSAKASSFMEQLGGIHSITDFVISDDPFGRILVGILMPQFSNAAQSHTDTGILVQLTILAIDLELHRLRHGQLPLDLASLPNDGPRTDPYTGAPLIYQRLEQEGWSIYSKGADQKDNGGNHDGYFYSQEEHDLVIDSKSFSFHKAEFIEEMEHEEGWVNPEASLIPSPVEHRRRRRR